MLQHEFEKLTGLKIDMDQYEVINGMKTTKIEKYTLAMCAAYIIGRLAVSLIFSI